MTSDQTESIEDFDIRACPVAGCEWRIPEMPGLSEDPMFQVGAMSAHMADHTEDERQVAIGVLNRILLAEAVGLLDDLRGNR